jgi:hypothetical protein
MWTWQAAGVKQSLENKAEVRPDLGFEPRLAQKAEHLFYVFFCGSKPIKPVKARASLKATTFQAFSPQIS